MPRHAASKTPTKKQGASKSPATLFDMSLTGYARVSTSEQDLDAQTAVLKAAGCTVIYAEHVSGAAKTRPEWDACKRSLGAGDTLIVTRIDRLGRSLVDLVSIIEDLGQRGVAFKSLADAIDTTTPAGRLTFTLAGAFAEYERALIKERTREGLKSAKARGATLGRPRALTAAQEHRARTLRAQGVSLARIARILGCSPSTIRRIVT